MAQRRIMTEEDKKAYAMAHGYMPMSGKLKRFWRQNNTKFIVGGILGVLIVAALIVFIYISSQPFVIEKLIGSSFDTVAWTDGGSLISVDEMNTYKLEKTYPGSLKGTKKMDCKLYRTEEESGEKIYVDTLSFYQGTNYLMYENQIYSYTPLETE